MMAFGYCLGAADLPDAAGLKTNASRLLVIVAAFASAIVLYLLLDAWVVWRKRRLLKMPGRTEAKR
jgi:hypothetical protein